METQRTHAQAHLQAHVQHHQHTLEETRNLLSQSHVHNSLNKQNDQGFLLTPFSFEELYVRKCEDAAVELLQESIKSLQRQLLIKTKQLNERHQVHLELQATFSHSQLACHAEIDNLKAEVEQLQAQLCNQDRALPSHLAATFSEAPSTLQQRLQDLDLRDVMVQQLKRAHQLQLDALNRKLLDIERREVDAQLTIAPKNQMIESLNTELAQLHGEIDKLHRLLDKRTLKLQLPMRNSKKSGKVLHPSSNAAMNSIASPTPLNEDVERLRTASEKLMNENASVTEHLHKLQSQFNQSETIQTRLRSELHQREIKCRCNSAEIQQLKQQLEATAVSASTVAPTEHIEARDKVAL